MRFGPVATSDAVGAVLAHSVAAGPLRLRKSHRLTAEDVEALAAAGMSSVIVATLDVGDLDEDEAARRLAEALQSPHTEAKAPATGRVNIHSRADGLLRVERAVVDGLNAVDPDITLATLPDFATVEAGQMVATVKIIPFAVAQAQVEAAVATLSRPAFTLHPFRARTVALIQTMVSGTKPGVLDKTAQITAARLARSGSTIVAEHREMHDVAALAERLKEVVAGCDMVIVFGASAVSDDEDVIPAAIRAAGGGVERVGMPVDPGNLLVLGEIEGKAVIGAPGCARSPKMNGFDWVLDRLMADLPVSSQDIASMGVGGLLMEIPTRPQPREAPARGTPPKVHAVVLGAGRSSRMGKANKLMAEFDGVPLARRTAERVVEAGLAGTVFVVGHQAERLRAALAGLPIQLVDNPDHAEGLSTSLKVGLRAISGRADGLMVVLADMPEVSAAALHRLAQAFIDSGGRSIVRATHGGKRGNPVILPRALFAQIEGLQGDTGARQIVETSDLPIIDVELGEAASLDVVTPEAMARAGGVLAG